MSKVSQMVKKTLIGVLAIFAIGLSNRCYSQNAKLNKKYTNTVERAESNFKYGDYHQSRMLVKNLQKKYVKEGAVETQNYAMLALYSCKYLVVLGKLKEVKDSLGNAIFYFNNAIKKDSSQYGNALLLLSDIYADYGNYLKAEEYLIKANNYFDNLDYSRLNISDTLNKKKKKPNYLDPRLDKESEMNQSLAFKQLRLLVDRGYFIEAQGEHDKLISYQASLTKREFPNADSTLKNKVTKIKKKEYKKRQIELADLYVLKADFLRLQGNYSKAASMYQENERLFGIMKISKKSFPTLKNHFGRTVMAENDGQLEKPYKVYKKLRTSVDRSHHVSSYHKFYNTVVEQEIQSSIGSDKNKKAKSLFLKYKLDNVHKYGIHSVYYLNALRLENEYNNQKKKFKKAIKSETELRDGIGKEIPNDNMANLKFNDNFYNFYFKHNKIEEARIERETNEWIAGINYGKEAPVYSMAELDLANFNIDMQDQFADSKIKYEKHFDKVIDKQLHNHHPSYSIYLKYYAKLRSYLDDFEGAYTKSERVLKIANERFGSKS